jgi:cyclopropane-fatty-acyl-phospholipid synthase
VSRQIDDISRRALFRILSRINDGRLELNEPSGRRVFGQTRFERPLTARVTVNDPHFYTAFFRGSLGLAESYIAGEWETDDLTSFVRIGARNMPAFDRARAVYRVAERPARALGAALHSEHRHKRRTAGHYNLGNELFTRMLGETMGYSSGIFASPQASLAESQTEKFDRVCRMLQLTPSDHLLEIGTGWGRWHLRLSRHNSNDRR